MGASQVEPHANPRKQESQAEGASSAKALGVMSGPQRGGCCGWSCAGQKESDLTEGRRGHRARLSKVRNLEWVLGRIGRP